MPPSINGADKSSKGELTLRLVIVMAMVFSAVVVTMYGTQPSWWAGRGAVSTGATTNDYAAINEGQLKEFAFKAVNELNANLPGYGAGTKLNGIVARWTNDYATNGYNATNVKPSDFQVIKVGQVKAVAGHVWRQLLAAGYTNSLPSWLVVNSSDYQLANIGQLKTAFDFDLLYDSDTNGLPDWWETHYFGGLGVVSPGSPASSGRGLTVLQSYEDGVSPVDYYSGTLPELSIVSGDGQGGPGGTMLGNPLVVKVTDQHAAVLTNAPVEFSVSGGSGQIATTGTTDPAGSQNVRTGSDGQASVYLYPSGTNGTVTRVQATATTGGQSASVTFTATTVNPANSIVIVSGDGQTGPAGLVFLSPLTVQATDGNGDASAGTPVQFSVSGSNAEIALNETGSLSPSQGTITGTDGTASVYLELGGSNGTVSRILVTATTGTSTISAEFSATTTAPPDLTVDPSGTTPGSYATIGAALNAVTQDYQTINVQPGTYQENLRINDHKVILRSVAGAASTIIDAGRNGSAVYVYNDSILDDFTIANAANNAVYVEDANARLINCVLQNNQTTYGVLYVTGGNLTAINCTCFPTHSVREPRRWKPGAARPAL